MGRKHHQANACMPSVPHLCTPAFIKFKVKHCNLKSHKTKGRWFSNILFETNTCFKIQTRMKNETKKWNNSLLKPKRWADLNWVCLTEGEVGKPSYFPILNTVQLLKTETEWQMPWQWHHYFTNCKKRRKKKRRNMPRVQLLFCYPECCEQSVYLKTYFSSTVLCVRLNS